MGRTRGARPRRVWLWRWRSSPLRRRSDVIEAWLLLVVLVLTLLTGALTGLAAAGAVDRSLAERRAESRAVPAVLAEDAADVLHSPVTEDGSGDGRAWVKVRWTAPDGTGRTGRTEAGPGDKAGSVVIVWTDDAGRLVPEPPGGADARFQTVVAGLTVAAATGGMVVIGGWLVRSRIRQRRSEEWEAEWRQVEPSWRRRMRG
ncbi:Rv1733c family protein [Streptomyces sp. P9-A2]|uniref:Rv1733c family protein n=1 Tax=Streptomyces sp. P9-A2 TaxID=3072284 RepID=UPI002FCA5731